MTIHPDVPIPAEPVTPRSLAERLAQEMGDLETRYWSTPRWRLFRRHRLLAEQVETMWYFVRQLSLTPEDLTRRCGSRTHR